MERLSHIHSLVQQQSLYSPQPGDEVEDRRKVLELGEILFEDLLLKRLRGDPRRGQRTDDGSGRGAGDPVEVVACVGEGLDRADQARQLRPSAFEDEIGHRHANSFPWFPDSIVDPERGRGRDTRA